MHELIQKLLDTGRIQDLQSPEELRSAAKELGFDEQDVAAALEDFQEFPLSDDELQQVAGGVNPRPPSGGLMKGLISVKGLNREIL